YAPVNHRTRLEAWTLEHLPLHRPSRRTLLEFWDDRTQHSIHAVLEEDLVECAQPVSRRFFVIIDERYQIAGRDDNGCITGDGDILLRLDPVPNGNTRSLGARLDNTLSRLVCVVIHNHYRKSEQPLGNLLIEHLEKLFQLCRPPVGADTDRNQRYLPVRSFRDRRHVNFLSPVSQERSTAAVGDIMSGRAGASIQRFKTNSRQMKSP